MVIKTKRFDVSEYLHNEEIIAEYLAVSAEDPNPEIFIKALADVAKARGMTEVARKTGLGRESLYKALAPGSKVRFETVRKIMDGLGVKFTISRS